MWHSSADNQSCSHVTGHGGWHANMTRLRTAAINSNSRQDSPELELACGKNEAITGGPPHVYTYQLPGYVPATRVHAWNFSSCSPSATNGGQGYGQQLCDRIHTFTHVGGCRYACVVPGVHFKKHTRYLVPGTSAYSTPLFMVICVTCTRRYHR